MNTSLGRATLRSVGLWWGSVTIAVSALAQPAPATKKAVVAPEPPPTHELVLRKWSGEVNVPDPVACTVDPQGRVYVSVTTRRKVGDLDIREHVMWIPDDLSFTSVEDRAAFYHRELAPGKMRAPRGSLKDHNGDGSIDWKDLTYHTERIYQLRDTDGDGTADKITVFAEGFNTEVTGIAAGVLYHDGWVYATIAPDLWRFKDTDDDGVADIREIVVHGFGIHIAYAGHDMHGPMVGPDGRIYWSIGDKGVNVTSKEGRHFYYPNEGAVLRVDPDGSNFEVYAHGLRNVQEPAFNEFGDLIGVDNDADQPGERERFVYIAEASDSGWRCNFQYMAMASPWMREGIWRPPFEGQPAYFLPPILSYSDGPAGFKYDTGTSLSDQQRGVFLLNEFPSGKMRAFRAEQDGATFKMADARIINDGIMGVGMSWHPDGSLLMVDWMGGYPLKGLGALWRVDAKDGAKNPARQEAYKIISAGFAQRPEGELVTQLGHADQRVRQGAQLELAKRGRAGELLAVARDVNAAKLARIHGLWGYGQLLRRNAAEAAAVLPLLQDGDAEIRAQTAKIVGDAAGAAAKADGTALIPLLADLAPRVRLQTAIALAKFREPTAVKPLLAMAAQDGEVPVLRHAVVTGLAGCATAEQLAAQQSHASPAVRIASVVALRRMNAPAISGFLHDRDPRVVAEAVRGIHDDLSIPAALPELAALLDAPAVDEATTRRAMNACLRVGTPEQGARLLAFALNESAPQAMRAEGLATLRSWKEPARLDIVEGRARPLAPAAIDGVLAPKLDQLLALSDPKLKTLAIEIMIAHRLKARPEQIAAIVADPDAPGDLRAQALRLLADDQREPATFPRALEVALTAAAPAPLHQEALARLLPGQPGRLVAESQTVFKNRTTAEKQHALGLLAKTARPEADAVLDSMARALVDGTIAPALKLDVIEALRARSEANGTLAAKLKAYAASPDAAAQTELLAGGDMMRGREVVANHLAANCMACHSVDAGGGSEVGPNLRTIGNQRDAVYLLRALLTPSADIAVGFGLVSVTLKDKTEVTGTLARETADAVTVRLFDGKTRTMKRTDIANQTAPISIMPPMLGILQPREIRDVVAYLGSLKTRPAAPKADGG